VFSGIVFSRDVYNKLVQHNTSIHRGEINVWITLCMILKRDIELSQNTRIESKSITLSYIDNELKNNLLSTDENTFFPSSVVLFYRSYFLNNQVCIID